MKHRTVKAQRHGTSMTLIVPAELKVRENALFDPQLLGDGSVLYSPVVSPADIEYDRKLIEQSFDDDVLLTPADMKKRFGKYGWGKNEPYFSVKLSIICRSITAKSLASAGT